MLWQLALAGESHARAGLTDEDYWKAVWPNTATWFVISYERINCYFDS